MHNGTIHGPSDPRQIYPGPGETDASGKALDTYVAKKDADKALAVLISQGKRGVVSQGSMGWIVEAAPAISMKPSTKTITNLDGSKWEFITIPFGDPDNPQFTYHKSQIGAPTVTVGDFKDIGTTRIYYDTAGREIAKERILPDDMNSGTLQEVWKGITDAGQLGKYIAHWNPDKVDPLKPGTGYEAIPVESIPNVTYEDIPGTDQMMIWVDGQPRWKVSKSKEDMTLPSLDSFSVKDIPNTNSMFVRLGDKTSIVSKVKGVEGVPDPEVVTFPQLPGRKFLQYGKSGSLIEVTDDSSTTFTPTGTTTPVTGPDGKSLGNLVQTGENQWNLIRPTADDQPTVDDRVEFIGGERVINRNGQIIPWPIDEPNPPAAVEYIGGERYIRTGTGDLKPYPEETPSMQDLIVQSITSGNWDAATALYDFQNRPSATDALNMALQYAKSPADITTLSRLARGEAGLVMQDAIVAEETRQKGEMRRVGEQPEFLRSAMERFQQSLSTERPLGIGPSGPTSGPTATPTDTGGQGGQPGPGMAFSSITQTYKPIDQVLAEYGVQPTSQESWQPKPGEEGTYQKGGKTYVGQDPGTPTAPSPDVGVNAVDLAESLGGFEMLVTTNPDGSRSGGSTLSVDQVVNIASNATRSGQSVQAAIQAAINQRRLAVISNAPPGSIVSQGSFSSKVADAPAPAPTPAPAPVEVQPPDTTAPTGGELRIPDPPDTTGEDMATAQAAAAEMESSPITSGVDIGKTEKGFDPGDIGFEPAEGQSISDWAAEFDAALSAGRFARGGTTSGPNLEIVGEEGPELVDLPPGTVVFPLTSLQPEHADKLGKLKTKGASVRKMAEGGIVEMGNPSSFPLGIQRLISGAGVDQPRPLLPFSGMTTPSAQSQRNLLPSEQEFLIGLLEQAGIPKMDIERELSSIGPGRGGGRAKFLPTTTRTSF